MLIELPPRPITADVNPFGIWPQVRFNALVNEIIGQELMLRATANLPPPGEREMAELRRVTLHMINAHAAPAGNA